MSTPTLYDVLGVSASTSPEDIRKAYRRRALQTHPDRLPQGSTPEQKSAAEEQFRQINAAYEVLSDENNRRLYDLHGTWPPPDNTQPRPSAGFQSPPPQWHQPFSQFPSGARGPLFEDPFFDAFPPMFSSPFPSFRFARPYEFRDPFELFNTVLGDAMANDPFFQRRPPPPFGGMFPPPPIAFGSDPFFARLPAPSLRTSSTYTSGGRGGQWVSESRSVRSINGRTESVVRRKDSQGNEHVVYTYPDGTTRTVINGVEQPSGALPPPQALTLPPPPLPSALPFGHQGFVGYPPQMPPPPQLPPPLESAHDSHEHRKKHWWHRSR